MTVSCTSIAPGASALPCLRVFGVLVLVWLGAAGTAAGQAGPAEELGAYRDTLDALGAQPFVLRPFLLPGSARLYLDGVRLDSTRYRLDDRHGRLWVEAPLDSAAVLVAVYRTWPFDLSDRYRRSRAVGAVPGDTSGTPGTAGTPGTTPGEFDPFAGVALQRSGSISRGILAGNNRDVTIESGLRMQLAGEVAEGVRVQAVLTDENTPILPEGTTQRLSEFDRVFIEIATRQGTAQLGDFDLRLEDSEFARFTRKLQGVTVTGPLPDPATPVLAGGQVTLAGATLRGIYHRQDLLVADGVQGPYRLEGRNNERFILVIPGSEEVFVDGEPMTRGETEDYVIDYSTGEVTFTARRLITDDLRITVEFQYRTSEFTRTLLGSEAQARFWQRPDGTARGGIGVTFLREADSRQFTEEFGLTPEDDSLLTAIGDSAATRSGAEQVVFDPEAPYVQYVRRDTTRLDGSTEAIYVPLETAPADTVAVYRVRFSRVGPGLGRYARGGRTVNGIVYEYRGARGGEYEPVVLLPKPRQQRLLDLRGRLEPLPGLEVFGEWAGSLNDENRFSPVGSEDDQGRAYLGGFLLKPRSLDLGRLDLGEISALYRRRFTGDHFASFDRTRPIEFARRWNLGMRSPTLGGTTVQAGDEVIDEAEVQLAVTPGSAVRGEVGRIRLSDSFEASRQAVSVKAQDGGWPRVDYLLEYIASRDTVEGIDGGWLRQRGLVEQPLLRGRLVPRLGFEQERRRQRLLGTDSLARASVAFTEWRPGLAWRTEKVQVGGTLELRTEDLWAEGALRDAGHAWTLQSEFQIRPGKAFNTDGSVGYRVRRFTEYFRIEQQQQNRESVVLLWNGRYAPFERAVNLNWFYEALTERTPQLQEIYIRTGPELGEYVWEDANSDGVVQLDEFLPERTVDEGTYVRTFIPSDTLSAIMGVQARVNLQLDAARSWRRAEARWKRLASHVATRTTFEVQEKSRDPELAHIYLLQLGRFRSPLHTLNGRLRIGQDLYLFRDASRYGVDLSFNQVRSLTELAAGEESRYVALWRLEGRYRPGVWWGARLVANRERNRTFSEQFASRRYDIEGVTVEPELSVNPSRALQLSSSLSFAQKRDLSQARRARIWKLPVDARYNRAQSLGMNGRFEMAQVQLEGEAVGLAEFELTDGRGPGRSYLWNLSGWYQLSRLLRATFTYTGRAPADAPTLHTLRVQLSAVF